MNFKNIMIKSAHNNFRRYIVRGFCSIIKSLSAFFLSFIILTSSVFGQYFVAYVSAAEVGALVAVDLITELAISGGIVAAVFKTASIIQGEISTGYGFGSAGLDEYGDSINQNLYEEREAGRITNAQAGYVNTLNDVPVEIICPIYGTYQFLCTENLANKIRTMSNKSDAAVKEVVNAYWSSVDILDQSAFENIASQPQYWVTNLDELDLKGRAMVNTAIFDTFGEDVSTGINPEFYQTGDVVSCTFANANTQIIRYPSNFLNQDYDYFVLRIPDWHVTSGSYKTNEADLFALYYHDPASDSMEYLSATTTIMNPRRGFDVISAAYLNGLYGISITWDRFNVIWPGASLPGTLDPTEVFPGWGSLWGIEATDGIDLIDWCMGDSRFWNTDILDLAIDEIADAVDAQVETGDTDVPIDLPIDIPVEGEGDVAWPSDDTDEDFDDPPAYPAEDDWADADTDVYPPFDPDPDPDPDPDNPDNPTPDNPEAPTLPPVNIPALLGLFPFCIPFDIKKAIEWFETDDQSDPVFYIPIKINMSGRQIIDYQMEINLTQHGIRTVVIFLKSAQVVAYIIVLCYATSKVIY